MHTPYHYPATMTLQWHLTERCNLRCSHCYQGDTPDRELSFLQLREILEQFKEMLRFWSQLAGRRVPGHINVTGGEPLLREDLFPFLELLAAERNLLGFALLSNGTLFTEDSVRRLKKLAPRFVQVSLEGGQETHDRLRGAANHARVLHVLGLLKKAGIPALVSFTAHKDNYREFALAADSALANGATRIWADRLIPTGSGESMRHQLLSPAETNLFFQSMLQVRNRYPGQSSKPACCPVAMHRALQFLVAGGKPYHCQAGDSLLALLPGGDLVPCRRMNIVVGNVLQHSLTHLYYNSNLLTLLRDKTRETVGCERCSHKKSCRGGLRCLAYALTGDPFQADPGCWLAERH